METVRPAEKTVIELLIDMVCIPTTEVTEAKLEDIPIIVDYYERRGFNPLLAVVVLRRGKELVKVVIRTPR